MLMRHDGHIGSRKRKKTIIRSCRNLIKRIVRILSLDALLSVNKLETFKGKMIHSLLSIIKCFQIFTITLAN